eukprot:4088508-Pyramimonas_sp.AAC.1
MYRYKPDDTGASPRNAARGVLFRRYCATHLKHRHGSDVADAWRRGSRAHGINNGELSCCDA